MATRAPLAVNALAVASPIPLEAPVTRATRSNRSVFMRAQRLATCARRHPSSGPRTLAALPSPPTTRPARQGPLDVRENAHRWPRARARTHAFATNTESLSIACDALLPTFTHVYADVIGARCTSCYQPGKSGVTAGALDLSTPTKAYAALVGVPASGTSAGASGVTCATLGENLVDGGPEAGAALLRVVPGDAADSLLYEKVSSRLTGTNPRAGRACRSPALT